MGRGFLAPPLFHSIHHLGKGYLEKEKRAQGGCEETSLKHGWGLSASQVTLFCHSAVPRPPHQRRMEQNRGSRRRLATEFCPYNRLQVGTTVPRAWMRKPELRDLKLPTRVHTANVGYNQDLLWSDSKFPALAQPPSPKEGTWSPVMGPCLLPAVKLSPRFSLGIAP